MPATAVMAPTSSASADASATARSGSPSRADERDDGRRDHRPQRRVRAQHQDPRRPEDRVADQAEDRRVQARDRRKAGQLRVRHPLRHQQRGQDQSRRRCPCAATAARYDDRLASPGAKVVFISRRARRRSHCEPSSSRHDGDVRSGPGRLDGAPCSCQVLATVGCAQGLCHPYILSPRRDKLGGWRMAARWCRARAEH